MRFKQKGTVSSLNDKPIKSVDQSTYQGNNISSTEMLLSFSRLSTTVQLYHMKFNKTLVKKLDWNSTK